MLVYRIVRAPERRVFSVEMGAASPDEEPLIIEKFRSNVTQQSIIDGQGRVEQRFNPMDMATDYYLPMRGGIGSKIENLPGGAFNGDIDDVEYIQRKLIAALHIPKAFLSFDESLCLSKDAKVLTLDNRSLTLPEIEKELSDGKDIFVYSSKEDGQPTVGKVEWCGKTKFADKLYRITLDNGKYFDCTSNHPIMMRDGTYKNAENVVIGDSCMPYYNNEIKITSIEIIDYKDWTWDLHVPEYHNFALEAGIYVHNSGKATLAQEDIRWARTVERVQKSLVAELTRLAMIHLYAKGVTNEDDLANFELTLTNPSNLSVLQRMEVWAKKLEVSRAALDSGLPNQWIQEQLFGFTKEEFDNNMKKRLEDAAFEAQYEKVKSGADQSESTLPEGEQETPVEMEPPNLAGVGGEDLYKHVSNPNYEEITGLAYVMKDIIDPLTERRNRINSNNAILKELKESDSLGKLNFKFKDRKSLLFECKKLQSEIGNEDTRSEQFAKFLK